MKIYSILRVLYIIIEVRVFCPTTGADFVDLNIPLSVYGIVLYIICFYREIGKTKTQQR